MVPDAILNDFFSQTQNPSVAVDDVLGQILGVQLDGDIGRFRSALARAFPADVNAATGASTIRYVPPSYAVQSLQSGTIPVTGALAGIQAQTTLLANEALAVLARLRPLHCACDAGVESLRDLIRREIAQLPALFAQDAGPNSKRIDMTFLHLTCVRFEGDVPPTPDPDRVGGQVGALGKRLGIQGAARTIEDEEIRTDFRIFVSYVWMLETAWAALRGDFDNAGADSLGVNTVHLNRRLLAIRYANADVYAALDEARVGPAERMTFSLASTPPITLADLLSWIDEIASAQGLAVIAAGQDGIATIAPVVDELLKLVCNDLKRLVDAKPRQHARRDSYGCGDPTFLSTDRTKAAVNKLALQLTELRDEVGRALKTEFCGSPDTYTVAPADHARK